MLGRAGQIIWTTPSHSLNQKQLRLQARSIQVPIVNETLFYYLTKQGLADANSYYRNGLQMD